MKLGCFLALLLYAGLVYGYFVWLGRTFDGRELWIASFVVGLIATFGIGTLWNSFSAWRDGRVLHDAVVDMPRRDGRRTAVAGTLEPLGQPLTAPLSGRPCVLYEYDIYRQVTRPKSGGGTETSKTVDFAGLGKAECVVVSKVTRLRLIGFPDLDPLVEDHRTGPKDMARARRYVRDTAWEDASGFGVLRGAGGMFAALTGNDESLRKDWRMVAVRDCPWLAEETGQSAGWERQPDTADDVSFDTGRDSDDYRPRLMEKRVAPGQQVVVIGQYDEVQQGIVRGGSQLVKIYLDDIQSVARKLSGSKWSNLIGGVLTLAIVNLGVWGAQEVYRRSDGAQDLWRQQLEHAVRDGDVGTIDKLCQRGADLNRLRSASDSPLLFSVQDPAIARLLIERGANVNATDADGTTPLMQAVRNRNPELVQVWIEAGANLDARNTNYHSTALMDAEGRCEECAELLRKAGARVNERAGI